MPSSAELLLPSLALHAPLTKRPFIGILSDDAHSAKASMMAEWEADVERKKMWEQRSHSLPRRQRSVYALADAVIHISETDRALERSQFNQSCARWLTLRMSPRGFSASASASGHGADGAGLIVGFMGNGITPTNHLAVHWFLQTVWPMVRKKVSDARLRLVGYPPDDRPKRQQATACPPASRLRCGWAWGTEYAMRERENGIDALGFLSEAQMLDELRTWRAMVVPILRSTGVNTKLFPALQLGIPIILTSVAASPLKIPLDDSVALVADTPEHFERQILRLYTQTGETRRLAAASSNYWNQMLADDAAASELSSLLQLVCPTLRTPADQRPLPLPAAPDHAVAGLGEDLTAARSRSPPHSKCFPSSGNTGKGKTPTIIVLLHGQSAGEAFALLAHSVWAVSGHI